jgi:hypothetical protein
MSGCCGGSNYKVVRTVLAGSLASKSTNLLRQPLSTDENLIDYKALAKRRGITRSYDVKVGLVGSNSPIGQTLQTIGSTIIPGDLGPIRSPIRSAIFGAITPGKPRIPGGTGGRDGVYRCPEGYQYGGRFTDNRFSTCGQKLFDIPSPLGALIGAARTVGRAVSRVVSDINARDIEGVPIGDSIVQSRRPQIPKVSTSNQKLATQNAADLVKDIGGINKPVARMVRRDGFVLEPVVSAQVLRAIPDNRDMEGANYLMSAGSANDLGGQELGLLSNTGVTKLTYVLPGGSTVTLEKKRPLTVGERRKLGRTVNSAAQIGVDKDPTARLKEVALQTGDGILYSENFLNIDNPNEVVSGKGGKSQPKWAVELFGKKKAPVASTSRSGTETNTATSKKIANLDDAIAHINSGGSLAKIDPIVLQKALASVAAFKTQKLDARRSILSAQDNKKYLYMTKPKKFEHLGQNLASDIQQHLGLESPDIAFVGTGDNRKYVVQDVDSVLPGFKLDRKKTFANFDPRDVAKIMVADWLSDERDRDPSTVIPVSNGDSIKPVITNNFTSGLTDLDKIEIVKRQKQEVSDFYSDARASQLKQYWDALKEDQKFSFRREIESLLKRARAFNFTNFKTRMYADGHLSDAEKAHIEIIGKILEQRINILTRSKDVLLRVLEK